MGRSSTKQEAQKNRIENIDTNKFKESENKTLREANKALAKAKALEAKTKTRAVISDNGKTVRFVKIKTDQ